MSPGSLMIQKYFVNAGNLLILNLLLNCTYAIRIPHWSHAIGVDGSSSPYSLIDFFRYFSREFPYTTDVASIRAGLLKKADKGWQNDVSWCFRARDPIPNRHWCPIEQNDPRFKDARERNRFCIEVKGIYHWCVQMIDGRSRILLKLIIMLRVA